MPPLQLPPVQWQLTSQLIREWSRFKREKDQLCLAEGHHQVLQKLQKMRLIISSWSYDHCYRGLIKGEMERYLYIYIYIHILCYFFHLFVSNASCLSLFTYYHCLMYCMMWWWYIIRALIAAFVQCQHGETEPCFNYNLAVTTYIASTYAYFSYLFIYLEINNGSSCKNNPLRSRSQQNQVHRMHIQFLFV